jgi:integrase
MKKRFRLIQRNIRGGTFYCVDTQTGKRWSLQTSSRDEAEQVLQAKNQAERQPVINLQIARAYLAASDSGITTRTWQNAMDACGQNKQGETKDRWQHAMKQGAFDLIRQTLIIETRGHHFLQVLKAGTVATNTFLRRLHNFALDMNWLPWPIIPRRQWPPLHFGEKRAITKEEHYLIIQQERNPERRAFYELCWHLGGAQSDIAGLKAEDIDSANGTISYLRKKTGNPVVIHLGEEVKEILNALPRSGPLFPHLINVRVGDRAKEFRQRCRSLGIKGVTLHSYRYAWAERAKTCGYPERFAQEALGHNSKAVHRAYAKRAQVKLPSLEDYEKKVVAVTFQKKSV